MCDNAAAVTRYLDRDTDIGGPAARFPATRRSAVLAVGSGDETLRALARERLVTAYWKPVYKYLRIRWKADNEDAKDWTQGYFAGAFEKGVFERYDPSRGTFRSYVRLSVDGFVGNERKAAGRLKRGGGVATLPLDFESAEGEMRAADVAGGLTPEECFDREWMRHLFGLSVEELRRELESAGRKLHWDLFDRYDLGSGGEEVSYKSLALEFGIPATQVTNHLAAVRRQFRGLVLARLRDMTATDAEFRSEARRLFRTDPP